MTDITEIIKSTGYRDYKKSELCQDIQDTYLLGHDKYVGKHLQFCGCRQCLDDVVSKLTSGPQWLVTLQQKGPEFRS